MSYGKKCFMYLLMCLVLTAFLPVQGKAATWPDPKTYVPSFAEYEKNKGMIDDPRPSLKDFGPHKILPKELYKKLSYDVESMKKLWADVVGFKSPDIVGKIAPEIKPGKYTYKDLEKNPGFKQLMTPDMYRRIKPGGPPHIGNIPEFEIIPTRQHYLSLPIAEMTKKNMGKTKLDGKGYVVQGTWEGGYPFPRPSGQFKAQQVMNNWEKRYINFSLDFHMIMTMQGYTANLKNDYVSKSIVNHALLAGRAYEPKGWFDKRAQERGEARGFSLHFAYPRDMAGSAYSALYYLDPNKADQYMMYISSLRRVRKFSSTDTQDQIAGADECYDDQEIFMQRLSPTRYPYEYQILEEKELLFPVTDDGAEYFDSKRNMELRNVKFERRPVYVVKMKQLDRNYIYGARIFYIDKETFIIQHAEYYDQKGRLYRTHECLWGWLPEMGMLTGRIILMKDHVDHHSSFYQPLTLPAFWDRGDIGIEGKVQSK